MDVIFIIIEDVPVSSGFGMFIAIVGGLALFLTVGSNLLPWILSPVPICEALYQRKGYGWVFLIVLIVSGIIMNIRTAKTGKTNVYLQSLILSVVLTILVKIADPSSSSNVFLEWVVAPLLFHAFLYPILLTIDAIIGIPFALFRTKCFLFALRLIGFVGICMLAESIVSLFSQTWNVFESVAESPMIMDVYKNLTTQLFNFLPSNVKTPYDFDAFIRSYEMIRASLGVGGRMIIGIVSIVISGIITKYAFEEDIKKARK